MRIKVKLVHPKAVLPSYQTKGSAGFDFCAVADFTLAPGTTRAIPTGLKMEIPEGYEVQVRSRSGLALKKGIIVLNAPGTIDSDFRGEVMVILANMENENFYINVGDRIAQGVVAPIVAAEWELSEELEETIRGEGGFGHTGINN